MLLKKNLQLKVQIQKQTEQDRTRPKEHLLMDTHFKGENKEEKKIEYKGEQYGIRHVILQINPLLLQP